MVPNGRLRSVYSRRPSAPQDPKCGLIFTRLKRRASRRRKAVTVTHPDISRYFMTIPEAARLVVQAAAIGESGQVLVLDMGEPVRIVDLARDMIRLSGRGQDEIRIEFSGLRPGEKLFEELLANSDTTLPTSCAGLALARLDDSRENAEVMGWLLNGAGSLGRADDKVARVALRELLGEAFSERA